jgi:predicted RecA/RadA family phage recombinase
MKTAYQEGNILDYTNPSEDTAIESGAVVVQGNRILIAQGKIPAASLGSLAARGVHSLAKKAATAFAVFEQLFWDESEEELTNVAADGVFAGYAAYAAGASDTHAYVLLANPPVKAANVAFAAGADLTEVPGSFADEAAVRTYLLTLVPEVETRLDAIETAFLAKLAADEEAGLQDAGA